MSDALTDIARDQERASAHELYLGALVDWLAAPDDVLYEKLIAAAQEVDSVRGGYFSRGKTDLATHLATRTSKLRDGDELAWSRLLTPLVSDSDHRWRKQAKKLYALSPFAGRNLVVVMHGVGFNHYKGDIDRIFREATEKALADQNARLAAAGRPASDGFGDYLVVMPADASPMTAFKVS